MECRSAGMQVSVNSAEQTTVSGSYDFTGPAEVVFDVLTDPDRVPRWLPRSVQAESVTTESVKVRTGDSADEYQVQIVTDRLEVSWHSPGDGGAHGTARVEDGPAGGSIVHAEVTVAAGAGDEETVTRLLGEAMRNLQRDADDNFNAG